MIFHSIAYWGVGSWLPAYLSKELGLGIQKSVFYLVIYNVGGLIGYGVCGYIADKWGRKYASYVGGIGSAAAILLWMNASSPTMAYIMGAFSGFFNYGYFGTLAAFLAEQFSTKIRGSALAFTYGSGRAFAGLSPFFLGSIAQATSLRVALMVTACFYALMAGTVYFLKETKGLALKD